MRLPLLSIASFSCQWYSRRSAVPLTDGVLAAATEALSGVLAGGAGLVATGVCEQAARASGSSSMRNFTSVPPFVLWMCQAAGRVRGGGGEQITGWQAGA